MTWVQSSLALQALLFASTGVWHFTQPGFFARIMPPWVPKPQAVNLLAGLTELALAAGLCFPATRRAGLLGILLLLVAVLPVHIHMLNDKKAGLGAPRWILWARLPVQGLLFWWAYATWLQS